LFVLINWAAAPVPATAQSVVETSSAQRIATLIDQGAYDQAEAAAQSLLDALTDSREVGSSEALNAADLLVRALVLNGKASAERTRMLAENTVERKQSKLGLTSPELVVSLVNLTDVLIAAGDYARAVQVSSRALNLQERQPEANDSRLGQCLDHRGAALEAAGQYDDALAILQRSLKLKESTLAPSNVEIARTLELLAWTLQRNGDYRASGEAIRRAIGLQEATGINHAAYSTTLNVFALQLLIEGSLTEAYDIAKRAVETAERALRPDHPTLARALRYQAAALMDLGSLVETRTLLERAVGIAERTFGPTHYDMWAYLNDLALIDLYIGDYTKSRLLFERAVKVAEAKVGVWHDRVGTTVNNLALVHRQLGDYAAARRGHARAAAIWERVFGRTHPFVARALMDLAAVYRDLGEPRAALPLLQRALLIREQRLGRDHRDVVTTLADLAATLRELGDLPRARDASARALEIWERLGTPEEGPGFATVPLVYADVQRDLGNSELARRYYERALVIQGTAVGRSHPLFAATQTKLASTLAVLGERSAAAGQAAEAEATNRNHVRGMLRYLPERQSLAYAATRAGSLELLLSLVTATDEAPPAAALDGVVRGRALVTDEMAARRLQLQSGDAEISRLRAQFVSSQQVLANLLVRGPALLDPAPYVAAVERSRRDSEAAERRLAERSATFREEMSATQVGIDQVRAALPASAVLVSFVRYQRTTWDASPTTPRTATRRAVPSYLAFVLAADRPVVVVPLGAASAIETQITRWRQDIATEIGNRSGPSSAATEVSRVSGSALRKLVWDPIAAHFAGARQVLIVPDGSLHLVPLAALPVGRSGYVLEEAATIHYLSTERDLVPRTRQPAGPSSARGLLALGAPAFDGDTLASPQTSTRAPMAPASARGVITAFAPECGDFGRVKFRELSGALQEAQDIATLWRQQPVAQYDGSARLLTGEDASERAFKRDAPGHRILHIATHGFFLGPDCSSNIAGDRGVGGLTSTGKMPAPATRVENPLLLSGLALAGANRRGSARPGEEDGVLTAEEVVSLNLDGVEWAVLSACETGVGRVHAGEGVFGLRRAFQVAGVRTVITSLWSVDDQATRSWMRVLYESRLQRQQSTADAMRAASLALLRERRAKGESTSPFYWAAFVAVGDSR
jgi:CHAT domain-containing protein/tetratricopeptide (TPR) repeat protein